jgi:hypothetical protein
MLPVEHQDFKERINALFGDRTMLLTPLMGEPELIHCGTFEAPRKLHAQIDYWREYFSQDGRYNEQQGILSGPLDLSNPAIAIPFQTLDFATAKAIREAGNAPPVLSVGTVAVCPARRSLYVHRRDDGAEANPSMLHSFSGGYRVRNGPGRGVIAEGLREFAEETGLGTFGLDPAYPPPRLALFRDNDYGALETCLLGVTLTPAEVDRLAPTAEGQAFEVAFDALPNSIRDGNDPWTEGGKLEVLTWLAMGAPPCPAETLFSGMSASQLFLKVTV